MLIEIVQWDSWIIPKSAVKMNSNKNKLNNKISWQKKKKLTKQTLNIIIDLTFLFIFVWFLFY